MRNIRKIMVLKARKKREFQTYYLVKKFTTFNFIKLKKNECYFLLSTVDTVKKYWVAEKLNQTISLFKFSTSISLKKEYIYNLRYKISKELFEANIRGHSSIS